MQATTFSIAVFGLSVVLGLCGQINLAQAAFFGFGAYAVGIGTADYQLSYWLCLVGGLPDRAGGRRVSGHVDVAARRPLSRDGDDLVPADRHAGHDQRDLAHAWAGRRLAASAGRRCFSPRKPISRSASRCWRSSAMSSGICRIRGSAAPCGRCATTNLRPASSASTCSAPRSPPLRSVRVLGGLGWRAVRRRLRLCQPGSVLVRRIDRVPDHVAARRRGVADRLGHRHGSADPDSGMAALPQERARTVSRDLRPRRHPDHPLHARRHLGICQYGNRALARADEGAAGSGRAAVEACDDRRRHRA